MHKPRTLWPTSSNPREKARTMRSPRFSMPWAASPPSSTMSRRQSIAKRLPAFMKNSLNSRIKTDYLPASLPPKQKPQAGNDDEFTGRGRGFLWRDLAALERLHAIPVRYSDSRFYADLGA